MKLETHDDQLMAMAAFGYCLGRATYIVPVCCEWLRDIWPQLTPASRQNILIDIVIAIQTGRGGHEMDVDEWLALANEVEVSAEEMAAIRQRTSYTGKPWPLKEKL